MKNMPIWALCLVVLMTGCTRQGETAQDAKSASKSMAKLATSDSQKELWKQAAETGAQQPSPPVVNSPVSDRTRVRVPNQAIKGAQPSLPEGLISGVVLIDVPELKGGRLSGKYPVARVSGERLELRVDEKRFLIFNARARGGPLRVKENEQADLDLRLNDDIYNRTLILGIKTASGDGLVSILDGGVKPVTVSLPLFGLVARQVGSPENHTMNVEVTVAGETKVLRIGQIEEFRRAGLSVGLIGSEAYEGESAAALEGNPYVINLTAWKTK